MLWYKGWLETRWKLLFLLAFYTASLIIGANTPPPASPGTHVPPQVMGLTGFSSIALVLACVMLAGAGIATQPSFVVTRGLHGSTLFTLSLPVTRLRLLTLRASLGWLEMVGVIGCLCGMWLTFPVMRAVVTPLEMFRFAVTLIACGSVIYFVSVLFGTFLEEVFRIWGSMLAAGALWLLFNKTPVPASLNIFRAMAEGSPLIARSMPWAAMAFSAGLGAILFLVALKVARTREY
jgi:hypothetical protein